MKTLIIFILLLSLGACKKSEDSGSSKNPTPPPNSPTPEPPEPSTPPPTISEITSVQKIYGSGSEVEFVVTFSKVVEVGQGKTPFLSLDVGSDTRQANFRRESGESDIEASFFYEVQPNDNDDDGVTLEPTLNLDGGSIQDSSGQDLVNTIPQEYLNFPDVKVDAIHPTISSVAVVGGSVFGSSAIVDLVATFNEPVKMTGVPSLILSVGGSTASADYQDKGESYSLNHTFRYTVSNGHSGSIQVTGLSVDLSNSISDGAENPTEENIPTPLSVSRVTVQTASSCATTVDFGFNGGSGSENSPYFVCTYAQLNKMRDNLTAHYELGQDINANPSWSAGDNGCTAYDGSTVPTTTPCTGWVPVGSSSSNKFQGHLDGGDHVISNLYLNISGSTKYGGLFGYTGSQSEISNMGLTNASVTVTTTAAAYGGGLVGYGRGTISNSYATGEVTASSSYSYSGGLVGYNKSGGTVSNSYATGGVTSSSSSSSHGGGLVGYNESGGTISNSYATGEVTSPSSSSTSSSYSYSSSYSGGLVGQNLGTISNSYATGEVTSSSSSSSSGGGLVGYNKPGGIISNSYATGEVTSSTTSTNSNSYGGGLVGYNYQGTVSNSYATGGVTSSAAFISSYSGGLMGYNSGGTISGTNYSVDSSGTNGLGSGTCSGTCTQKTLAELQALTSTDVTDWSTDNWGFGTTTQLPRVKYAPTATYCTDDTHMTQQACEDASESWVIEGCGGDTGVTCGDVISGQ